MARFAWSWCVLAACLLAPGEALAQTTPTTLYVAYSDVSSCTPQTFPACRVSRLLRATLDGPRSRVDWQRVVPRTDDIKQGYVTPDARYVVWLAVSFATGPNVYVHDVVTGQTRAVGPLIGPEMLLGNPVRPEVYVFDRIGVITMNPAGTRRVDFACQPNSLDQPPEISADGRLVSVVVSCPPPAPPESTYQTVVFDTETDAIVTTVARSGVVSADGRGLFTRDFGSGRFLVQRRTLDGQLLSEASNPGMFFMSDRATGDVLTWSRGTYPNLHVLDGSTLATKWSTNLSVSTVANYLGPVFDSLSGFAAAFNEGLGLVDVRARLPQSWVALTASPNAAVMFGPPPPAAPAVQPPAVSGGSVQLSWAPGGPAAAITRYVLEVGSASGLNDIIVGIDAALQTSFSANGVPPGRYYVRVRAANYTGLSAPSNEVVVQVP